MNNWSLLFIIFFGIKKIIQFYLLFRQRSHLKNNFDQVPVFFKDDISLEEHQKSIQYSLAKSKVDLVSLIISAIVFIIIFPMGFANYIDLIVSTSLPFEVLKAIAFFGVISLFEGLITLPIQLYRTFKIEQDFGFNNTSLKLFITDLIKQAFIGFAFMSILLGVIIYIMQTIEQWWVLAFIVLTSFQLIIFYLYPNFIAPMFNKFSPVQDPELSEKLEILARKVEFPLTELKVMDASRRSSHGNAYFTGIGNKKKIVLFDTLIEKMNNDEIEAVLAHELGHFKLGHIKKNLLVTLIFSLIGLFLLNQFSNYAEFYHWHFVNEMSPHMALFLFTQAIPIYLFWLTPITSYLSRKREFEADEFASKYSEARNLISALKKLSKSNASVLEPDPVFVKYYYSHPPLRDRISHLNQVSE